MSARKVLFSYDPIEFFEDETVFAELANEQVITHRARVRKWFVHGEKLGKEPKYDQFYKARISAEDAARWAADPTTTVFPGHEGSAAENFYNRIEELQTESEGCPNG